MASKEASLSTGLNAIPKNQRNPQRVMTYEDGAFDTYKKYKVLMFKEQMSIYQNITRFLCSQDIVLEAGCGIGLGTAILERAAPNRVFGSDKCLDNVHVARELYPWIPFHQWDCRTPLPSRVNNHLTIPKPDVVVAIEVIEHMEYPVDGIFRLIDAAKDIIYLSTPNGHGKPRPPSNPYHVCEYTPAEMLSTIMDHVDTESVTVLHPETFIQITTQEQLLQTSPLVYRISKRSI